MSRSLTTPAQDAIVAKVFRAASIVQLDFDSGPVRFWGGIGPLPWNGNTFTGAGNLGNVSAVEETAETKATGLTFSLSGIPSELIAVALGEHYQGRACAMWIGLFDENWALIDDPVLAFSGRMDVMLVEDGGRTCTIQVTAENRLIDLDRPNETRYYTDQDQQAEYSGDRFFEFVPAMQEAVVVWGSTRVVPTSPSAPISGATPSTGAVPSGGWDVGNGGDGAGGSGGGGEGSGAGADASGSGGVA